MKEGTRRGCLRSDEGGVANVIEFVSAFLIFVIILAAFFTGLSIVTERIVLEDLAARTRAESLSTQLISSTGGIMDSGELMRNWEDYPVVDENNDGAVNIYEDLAFGGLAYEGEVGVVDAGKLARIANANPTDQRSIYTSFKRTYNIEDGRNFDIALLYLDTDELYFSWPGENDLAISQTLFTRYVLLRTGDGSLHDMRMIFTFYEGGIGE